MAQNNLTSKSENYEDMLIYIAELYYLKGLSQQQIADLTHQSRTNISRLLKICVEKGIVELPGSLHDALIELENDPIFRQTLGNDLFDSYVREKWMEWDEYRLTVSDWEIERYLRTV